ncbi:ABC transporter ATP-binding protein [Brevibacillus dissolubilis]|uniref:ABC transporter ATP-binding protein n=1 Tax=Brevibacillus dissolubilis TaxID=1844116 RepID=UPI0011175D37|nr:ABC transporter ATP-binding protein [Brevibacillus dissolubilis]
MSEFIRIENLTYQYPEASEPALTDVTAEIGRGEFVLLLGNSGSGKSTFLRALNGLVPRFYGGTIRGEVELEGRSLSGLSQQEIVSRLGFLNQDPERQLLLATVERELVFGMENLGNPLAEMKSRLAEISQLFGLGPILQEKIVTLSGGQKQRVALASVLAPFPQGLLLDEPTSQLDPIHAEEVLHALRRLNEDWGLTVVLSEHRVERCFHVADRILLFEAGRLVYNGSRDGFVQRAQEEKKEWQAFLPPVARYALGQGWGEQVVEGGRNSVVARVEGGSVATVARVEDGSASAVQGTTTVADGKSHRQKIPLTVKDARAILRAGGKQWSGVDETGKTGSAVKKESITSGNIVVTKAGATGEKSVTHRLVTKQSGADQEGPSEAHPNRIQPNQAPPNQAQRNQTQSNHPNHNHATPSPTGQTFWSKLTSLFTKNKPDHTSQPNQPILTITKAQAGYDPHQPIIRDLTYTLHQHDRIALFGENGAGKSTLAKLLAGVITPTTGTLMWNNEPIRPDFWQQAWRRIGYLSQNPNDYFLHDTVEAEILFTLTRLDVPKEQQEIELVSLLDTFGLLAYRYRHPHDLSGGERQRLALAIVLAGKPDVLLLDEPTRGLDLAQKENLCRLLHTLPMKAVLMITHDVEFAATYANRVTVLFQGQVVADGEPDEVFGQSFAYMPQVHKVFR